MFDLIALTRNEIAIGKLSPEAGQQRILSMKSGFKKIMADPTSTTKKMVRRSLFAMVNILQASARRLATT